MRNLFEKAVERQAQRLAKAGGTPSAEELATLLPEDLGIGVRDDTGRPSYEEAIQELDGLIGLGPGKAEGKKLAARSKINQEREALGENLRPENRVYRYNYFYNNCTTKARDVIEQCINGKVEYAEREDYSPTYRDMVHDMTERNPWSRFGNDLLLGIKADQPTNLRQQEFLPHNLMYDFDRAQIYVDGTYRPLVKERRVGVPPGVQMHEPGFPLSPMMCFIILLAVGLVIFLIEWKLQRIFIMWEVLLMLVTGIIGIVLTLMLFSQHPTVSLNLQIILFNPLPFFFLWPVIRGKKTYYWHLTAILSILFLIGGLFQSYAEGIWNLALCLLLQCCLHLWRKRENGK